MPRIKHEPTAVKGFSLLQKAVVDAKRAGMGDESSVQVLEALLLHVGKVVPKLPLVEGSCRQLNISSKQGLCSCGAKLKRL